MFQIALITGIYSYIIFALGITGKLYVSAASFSFIVFFLFISYFIYKDLKFKKNQIAKLDKFSLFLLFLIVLQSLVNFVGVLGPEISFDALWYHLTLPKIYLLTHQITHFSGGLLYYSDMPKLIEMVFTGSLALGGETLTKFISYLFGILSLVVIYKISRIYLPKNYSLLSVLIFYSNLVVGWESISAYVDLPRTFFELLAIYVFILWIKNRHFKSLLLSGLILGLAVATKLISLFSILPFIIIIFMYSRNKLKDFFAFLFLTIFVSTPWLLFSFINTGNPIYPYGQIQTAAKVGFFEFSRFFEDPVSPVYLIIFPLVVTYFKKIFREYKFLILYCITGILLWYLTSRVAGSRYLMPQIAVFSILVSVVIDKFVVNFTLRRLMLSLVIVLSIISIIYRGVANYKFVPVILGNESKTDLLAKNLNFSYGDFYDVDGYFGKHINSYDKVLLFGFHNLYYINFPFIDSSFVKKGDKFNYVATQNTTLPKRFSDWKLVYTNSTTKVNLYSLGGMWVY